MNDVFRMVLSVTSACSSTFNIRFTKFAKKCQKRDLISIKFDLCWSFIKVFSLLVVYQMNGSLLETEWILVIHNNCIFP
jgi:hypothetical protein